MNKLRLFTGLLGAAMVATVPAWAVSNPNTGDNSMVAVIVGVMAAAAIGLVVVLLLTRGKK